MIKSTTLFTYESDSPDDAWEEIEEQFKERIQLLSNTIGIIACNKEFIHNGITARIKKELPFPIIGVQTMTQAVNGEVDVFMLSVLVMTSDDVRFTHGEVDNVTPEGDAVSDIKAAIGKSLGDARALGAEPKLLLAFVPFVPGVAGDSYIEMLNEVTDGLPVFGCVPCDETLSYEGLNTIGANACSANVMSYCVLSGNVEPKFFVAAGDLDRQFSHSGIVTKSNGNIIMEINHKTAFQYYKDCGLLSGDTPNINGLEVHPAATVLNYGQDDGIPVYRAVATATPEGYIIFGGNIYEGSTISHVGFSGDSVVNTTKKIINTLNGSKDVHTVLMFSCIARRIMCESNPTLEVEEAVNTIRPDINFMFAYAGGEYGPTSVKDGRANNRFHNFTLVVCAL